ncbi:MAG: ANTAR domain-containing protein [Bryobacteraceae bacterium]
MPKWSSRPFRGSLEALAQLALQETGALAFEYYEIDEESGAKVRLAHGGVPMLETPAVIVEYALHHDGEQDARIAFTFAASGAANAVASGAANEARERLDRIAASIESLWTAGPVEAYQNLLQRLAGIEVQLIDSKIADRARGFLTAQAKSDPADAIARHVEGVLRPSQARITLEQAVAELEEEMEERKLVAAAKEILQSEHGMSEEQAHSELRIASRKSRKRLKEVALYIIERRPLPEGKIA